MLVAGALLAACGTSDTADEQPYDADALDCQGSILRATQLESAPPASSLPESARKAFAELTAVGDIASYRVLSDKDGYLTIGASLSERQAVDLGPAGQGPINFQMATIESSNSGGPSAFGWWYVENTTCELQRRFHGLVAADVWLDPSFPAPKAGDSTVHLLVSERACAGGEQAGDRIKVAELVRDTTQVRIAVAVKPQSGSFTCPGIPPEPFVVNLDSPLGDERVVNSAAYPARPFAPPNRNGG